MKSYPVFLFDLDGTISESAPGIVKAVQYGLSFAGIHETDPEKLKTELEAYDKERNQGLPSGSKKDDLKFFAEDDRGQPCSADIKPDCATMILYNGTFEK